MTSIELIQAERERQVSAEGWTGCSVSAIEEILQEVERATHKFPTWPTDPIHALAVLGEEFGELTKEILQATYEPQKTLPGAARKEAIQTAAMAIRFVMSLDVYATSPCAQHSQEGGAA